MCDLRFSFCIFFHWNCQLTNIIKHTFCRSALRTEVERLELKRTILILILSTIVDLLKQTDIIFFFSCDVDYYNQLEVTYLTVVVVYVLIRQWNQLLLRSFYFTLGASIVGRLGSWIGTISVSLQGALGLVYIGEILLKSVPFTQCEVRNLGNWKKKRAQFSLGISEVWLINDENKLLYFCYLY